MTKYGTIKTGALAMIFAALGIAMLMTGCGTLTTPSTVTEYDASGKITKVTTTPGSVIPAIIESTKGKTVIAWEDGWAGYISVSSGTTDDPTPHGKIFAGKVNKGAISMLPNQQGLPGIARIIQATKSNLSVGMDGMTSESADTGGGSNKNTASDNK